MKNNHVAKCAGLSLAVCGFMAVPALAADYGLVHNGGFEVLPPYTGSGEIITTTVLPDWNVTLGDVDLVRSSYWGAPEGNYSLDLSGNSLGWIEQKVTPTVSGQYRLSFYYGANPDGGPSTKFMMQSLGNEASHWFSPTPASGQPRTANWIYYSQLYTLNAGESYWLKFASLTPTPYGPTLDGVSLTLVPEPYHYGLASILVLGGLALVDRARQRRLTS